MKQILCIALWALAAQPASAADALVRDSLRSLPSEAAYFNLKIYR